MKTKKELFKLLSLQNKLFKAIINSENGRILVISREFLHPCFMYYVDSDSFKFYSETWFEIIVDRMLIKGMRFYHDRDSKVIILN